MAIEEKVICVGCPLGCEVTLTVEVQGKISGFSGNACKEGREYAAEEYNNPVRILTTAIPTENSSRPLLPVRTSKPILKTMLKPGMTVLAGVRVKPPIRMGDILVKNLLDTGVDIVAGSDLTS